MSTRVAGAILALTAAALLMASLVLPIVGTPASFGWWAGHPEVAGRTIAAKHVSVGLLGGTGCNTGGDGTCSELTLSTGFSITGYVELGIGGLLTLASLGLGVLSLVESERRKRLSRLVIGLAIAAASVAILLIMQGPKITATQHVVIPIGYGTYVFWIGAASSILASVLALRPDLPLRLRVSRRSGSLPSGPTLAAGAATSKPLGARPMIGLTPPQAPLRSPPLPAVASPGGSLAGPAGPLVPPPAVPPVLAPPAPAPPAPPPVPPAPAPAAAALRPIPPAPAPPAPAPTAAAPTAAAPSPAPPSALPTAAAPPPMPPVPAPFSRPLPAAATGFPGVAPIRPLVESAAVPAKLARFVPWEPASMSALAPTLLADPAISPDYGAAPPPPSPPLPAAPAPVLGASAVAVAGPPPPFPPPLPTLEPMRPVPTDAITIRADIPKPTTDPAVALPTVPRANQASVASLGSAQTEAETVAVVSSARARAPNFVAFGLARTEVASPGQASSTRTTRISVAPPPVSAMIPKLANPDPGDELETLDHNARPTLDARLSTENDDQETVDRGLDSTSELDTNVTRKLSASEEILTTEVARTVLAERGALEIAVPRLLSPVARPTPSLPPSDPLDLLSKIPITTAPDSLPAPKSQQTAADGPSPACPQCEDPMHWVDEHLRFYCKHCRMYF